MLLLRVTERPAQVPTGGALETTAALCYMGELFVYESKR